MLYYVGRKMSGANEFVRAAFTEEELRELATQCQHGLRNGPVSDDRRRNGWRSRVISDGVWAWLAPFRGEFNSYIELMDAVRTGKYQRQAGGSLEFGAMEGGGPYYVALTLGDNQ